MDIDPKTNEAWRIEWARRWAERWEYVYGKFNAALCETPTPTADPDPEC